MSQLHDLVIDNESCSEGYGRDSVREKRMSGLMSPGSELLTESSSLRIHNLFADDVISKEQRDILKAQIEVKNTEVMRDLCLLSDEKLSSLADDLLFQANSFTNIDGAGGSTLYALRTTGENLESPKRPLSLRRQLSMKRNSWLGSLQDTHSIPGEVEGHHLPQPINETVSRVQQTSRTKSPTKIFTAEEYFHRLKDKNRRMGTFQNPSHQGDSSDTNRSKRPTDIPAVYVVRKNKPKTEPLPPRTSLPLKKTTSRDDGWGAATSNKNPLSKSDSKELPRKGGFFSGLTNLFKKKPASVPKKENLVVNTADDEFEFHSATEDGRIIDSNFNSEADPPNDIPDTLEEQTTMPDTVQLSPPPINPSPGSPEAPLWEIFSKSPGLNQFEGSNISSEQDRLDELSAPNHEEVLPPDKSSIEGRAPPPTDDDDTSMEVWECYQSNEDTVSENTPKERKITWLFSNGQQMSQPSQFEKPESDSAEGEVKKAFLPLLFGNIVSSTPASKKEYSKYYMKPLEIRSSSLKKPKTPSCPKIVKHVSYSSIEIRFYNYTIGQGVPSDGGPSLGLNWEYDPSLTLHTDVESFEEFRGGIVPEDADEDEEWDDNWRIPREYFLDAGGRLAPEVRINHLKSAGHRRCSVDLSSYLCKQDMASRVKNSRSRAARLLIDGTDPDEVMILQQEWEARQVIEPYIMQWVQKRKLNPC